MVIPLDLQVTGQPVRTVRRDRLKYGQRVQTQDCQQQL